MSYNKFYSGRGRGGYSRGGHHTHNHNQRNFFNKPKFEDLPNEEQIKTLNYITECLKTLITPKGIKFQNNGNISWANDPFTQMNISKKNESFRKKNQPAFDNNAFITNEIYYTPGKIHNIHTFFKFMCESGLLNLLHEKDNDRFIRVKAHDNAFDLIQNMINKCNPDEISSSDDEDQKKVDSSAKCQADTPADVDEISSDEDED